MWISIYIYSSFLKPKADCTYVCNLIPFIKCYIAISFCFRTSVTRDFPWFVPTGAPHHNCLLWSWWRINTTGVHYSEHNMLLQVQEKQERRELL